MSLKFCQKSPGDEVLAATKALQSGKIANDNGVFATEDEPLLLPLGKLAIGGVKGHGGHLCESFLGHVEFERAVDLAANLMGQTNQTVSQTRKNGLGADFANAASDLAELAGNDVLRIAKKERIALQSAVEDRGIPNENVAVLDGFGGRGVSAASHEAERADDLSGSIEPKNNFAAALADLGNLHPALGEEINHALGVAGAKEDVAAGNIAPVGVGQDGAANVLGQAREQVWRCGQGIGILPVGQAISSEPGWRRQGQSGGSPWDRKAERLPNRQTQHTEICRLFESSGYPTAQFLDRRKTSPGPPSKDVRG